MIEVHHNLFVGSEADEALVRGQSDWFVVHACKEPYHRQALGYQGRAAANPDFSRWHVLTYWFRPDLDAATIWTQLPVAPDAR